MEPVELIRRFQLFIHVVGGGVFSWAEASMLVRPLWSHAVGTAILCRSANYMYLIAKCQKHGQICHSHRWKSSLVHISCEIWNYTWNTIAWLATWLGGQGCKTTTSYNYWFSLELWDQIFYNQGLTFPKKLRGTIYFVYSNIKITVIEIFLNLNIHLDEKS